MKRFLPILALVLLTGCATAPPASPDLGGVDELLLALPGAWNARDADAWVARFAEESTFTNILGMHFPDRAANRTRHAELFRTIFADSELSARVLRVRPVGERAAIGELEFTLVGYDRLPPGIVETAPGELRTRLVTVLERRDGRWTVVAAQNTAILPVAAGRTPPPDVAAEAGPEAGGDWIDLTHPLTEDAVFWPTATEFRLDTVAYGETEGGWFYSAFDFTAAEHGGTHLDAPIHFARGRHATDEIPLERLIAPGVVVDVSGKVDAMGAAGADYEVSPADLREWEAEHGPIPDGAILLLRTGWGERYADPGRYLGTTERGPDAVPLLHFPGLAPEAARWLVEHRAVAAVGIDTPSIDRGQSTDFGSHVILYSENVPGFENVANLGRLPATGSFVVALPTKIGGGSGGPLRIVARLPG